MALNPGYDAVFPCPLIPTDSAQLLAAVATGSTMLGSIRSELYPSTRLPLLT
jgi:hypothetical protein